MQFCQPLKQFSTIKLKFFSHKFIHFLAVIFIGGNELLTKNFHENLISCYILLVFLSSVSVQRTRRKLKLISDWDRFRANSDL